MKNKFFSLLLLGIIFLGVLSCKKKDPEEETEPTVPTTYNFSNVDISGQVVRLLLLMELESKMQQAKATVVTNTELRVLFDSVNSSASINKYTNFGTGKSLAGSFFASSANLSLQGAMKDSIRKWLDTIAVRSGNADALIRSDGVDLSQAVAKTIMGGVFYDQAVNKYLVNVTTADNSSATFSSGKGTNMEHYFDEAFGYFGAARDYNNLTDAQLAAATPSNADGNNSTDTLTEMNFKYYAATAAKRDATGLGTDFTKELFDAFLLGRYSISNVDYASRDAAILTIKTTWEEIIAATVLHYINDTKADIASSSADLNKHWSEMKFYFNMIPLYPSNKVGSTEILAINLLLGNKPSDTNATALDQAAEKIRAAYGFTTTQRDNW